MDDAAERVWFPLPEVPTYRLSWEIDLPILAVAGPITFAWLLAPEATSPDCATEANGFLCDPEDVNAIDRGAAGNYDPSWSEGSNYAWIGTSAALLATVFVAEDFAPALNDLVVGTEALAITSALGALTTLATGRARPKVYSPAAPAAERAGGEQALSFFSGHVATIATVTTYTFTTLYKRNVHPVVTWGALGVGAVGTGVVAAGRILGGNHFPTDVFMGAAVGTAVGFLVPALHDVNVMFSPEVSSERVVLSVSGAL